MTKKRVLNSVTGRQSVWSNYNEISTIKSTNNHKKENQLPPLSSNFLTAICHRLFGWLPPKYEKVLTRSFLGLLLIILIWIIFYVGIAAMVLFFTFVVVQCYSEVISIGYRHYKDFSFPLFRFLQWFFLFSATFYVSGDIFILVINNIFKKKDLLPLFTKYQKIIAFGLYIIGIIIFVLNLQKKKYRMQFSIFAWYQLTLMILMVPLQLLLKTVFFGLIWVFLPMSLIVINDISAYFVGIAFGKTPLIKLSPKKTWEGFIGGILCTMIGALVVCHLMVQYPIFYCPVKFDTSVYEFVTKCERSALFTSIPQPIPKRLLTFLNLLGYNYSYINYYPMYTHAIILGLFASLISPFGGFFASGFKRAFKVKDFGDSIPGHGGMMDRMDCQVLMCVFVNIYIRTFIRNPNPNNLMYQFMQLSPTHQREFYRLVQGYIHDHSPGNL